MDITMVLTQVLGILFIVLGISTATSKKMAVALLEEMNRNRAVLWMVGFMALVFGAVLVMLNNTWTSGLPLLITIVGWVALIKGVFILVFPNTAAAFYKKCVSDNLLVLAGIVCFILGLLFLYW